MARKRPQLNWSLHRFTHPLLDASVYIELTQVAAIRPSDPVPVLDGETPLPVVRGAAVILNSGERVLVRETEDQVFDEVHRVRTQVEPAQDKMRVGDAPL